MGKFHYKIFIYLYIIKPHPGLEVPTSWASADIKLGDLICITKAHQKKGIVMQMS